MQEVEGILNLLTNISNEKEGDYYGSDGLLYCGLCRTRKQTEVRWADGNMKKVPVVCKCKEEERNATAERIRKEEEMYELRRARISSMMDTAFEMAVFDNFKKNKTNLKHWKISTNYCKEFQTMYDTNQGLLFYGNPGTGKSYIAACIANYLLDSSISVVMTSFVRILQEMQGFDKEREETFTNKLSTVRLLIIDDLGAERNTDYALEKVYGIIDNRYRAKKPLILTTNLTLAQMQVANDIRYERIYDRIFEMCYPVEFTGVSWRKREAAVRFEHTKKILEG